MQEQGEDGEGGDDVEDEQAFKKMMQKL